ncbi:SGNH_hydrolase domain containing protein [Candidatus Nanopelagicaceae bacterium]
MEHQQSITVLGGSAASSFSDAQKISWPYLLKAELPQDIVFKIETRPSLTFVRALNELIDFPNEDLLILHFGTSIGWPISLVRIGHKMGLDFKSEVSFHQAAHKSAGLMNQLRKRSRARFRNTVKYLLFFLGLYKSRVSRREIADQIDTVVHLAAKQSKRIIWVQHQALQNRRIYLERRSYAKYYKEILAALEKYESATFALVTLPDDFMVQENYLLDCVHLSDKGHRILADLLKVTFKKLKAPSSNSQSA